MTVIHPARLVSLLLLPAACCRHAERPAAAPAVSLFNGRNLDGFTTWLVDTRHADPRGVFRVQDGMIHVSGDGLGYLATKDEFADCRLTVEFKWGARNTHWGERTGRARDSGIFLFATGPDGNSHDGAGAFMAAIECNLFEGATGDLLLIRGTAEDGALIAPRLTAQVGAERDVEGWRTWQRGGGLQSLERMGRLNWSGKSPHWRDVTGFRGPRDVEHPPGGWNTVVCRCEGGRLTVQVNGAVVNEAFDVWPRRGRILLQCEGSEIWFRRVEVEPLR